MNTGIHYVRLDEVPMEPHALPAACGVWCAGTDWTTKHAIVSCLECRARLIGLALLVEGSRRVMVSRTTRTIALTRKGEGTCCSL